MLRFGPDLGGIVRFPYEISAGFAVLGGLFGFLFWALAVVVTIVLAVLVYRDADKHRRNVMGITPPLWLLIVLFTSFLGVVGYWLMNHSSLASGEKA